MRPASRSDLASGFRVGNVLPWEWIVGLRREQGAEAFF